MMPYLVTVPLMVAALAGPPPATRPLAAKFKVGKEVPILWELRATGPRAGQDGSLKCTFAYQPAVVVYCRTLDAPVRHLIKQVEQAAARHNAQPIKRFQERLGSYVVLFCDSKERAAELVALAKQENIQHTILALVVVGPRVKIDAILGEADTTVYLTGPRHLIKASFAYRKGELKSRHAAQVLAELPRVIVKK